MDLKFHQRNISSLEKNYNMWVLIFIKGRSVCIKPLQSRLEAIQKLKLPMTVKGCRKFLRES